MTFSYRPQYTASYPPKLTIRTLFRPIKYLWKIWIPALPGGALSTYPSKLNPQNFSVPPGGAPASTAPPGYAPDVLCDAVRKSSSR